MPACYECELLVAGRCTAAFSAERAHDRKVPPPPLGNCEIPIVDGYLGKIHAGMVVLEIGCGSWSAVRDHCQRVGARYEAIDILTGGESVATRFENLASLSFEDDAFDVVIATQSMEHWAEYGCSLRWGLYQLFRVCRPGGVVLLNFPMHFHGTSTFMLGKTARLHALFSPFSRSVVWEAWGSPSAPHPACHPHPGYWALRDKPAYVMDVQAIKDMPMPSGYSNRGARQGWYAKLMNRPLSYSLYAAGRRVRIFPPPLERPAPVG